MNHALAAAPSESFTAAAPARAAATAALQLGATICPAAAGGLDLWSRWVTHLELRDPDLAVAAFILARPHKDDDVLARQRRREMADLAQCLAAVVPPGPASWGCEMRIISVWAAVLEGAADEAAEEKRQGIVSRIDVAARIARRELAELLTALEWLGQPGPGLYQGMQHRGRWCTHCLRSPEQGHDPRCHWPRVRASLAGNPESIQDIARPGRAARGGTGR